jgi:peptidoglycan hydrolase-like protein with peptidoglycan-binding domain
MTRFKILSMASAVAAAFVVSTAPAQQTTRPDSSRDVQQRDATGNPSGSPTQPPRSTASDPTMYGPGTVRDVQQALQDKGYDVGPVDGVIGPRTQSALRQFQQQQGIPSSGRLDSRTLGALNVSSAGMSDRSGVTGSSSSSGRMGDRSAGATGGASTGAVGTGNPGGAASETPRSSGRVSGGARTGNPGSGTIGSSPSGAGTPPASSTTGSSSGRTGG